jgi:hypothetical protein
MATLQKIYVLQTVTLGYVVGGSGGSMENPAGSKTLRIPLPLPAGAAAAVDACTCGVML